MFKGEGEAGTGIMLFLLVTKGYSDVMHFPVCTMIELVSHLAKMSMCGGSCDRPV